MRRRAWRCRACGSSTENRAIDVPLTRVIRPISGRLEQVGKQGRPLGALIGRITIHLLRIVARQQRSARWPASRRVVEAGVAKAATRQLVEVRGGNLGTVTADVREAEVVCENEDDIRSLRDGGFSSTRRKRQHRDHREQPGEPSNRFDSKRRGVTLAISFHPTAPRIEVLLIELPRRCRQQHQRRRLAVVLSGLESSS